MLSSRYVALAIFFFNDTATTEIYTLSLHDALPICGRTYLGEKAKPLGKVLAGWGNNGKDNGEGAIYKNVFGTYLHGPVLPKNPWFTDLLIQRGLAKRYGKVELTSLDNTQENAAHAAAL